MENVCVCVNGWMDTYSYAGIYTTHVMSSRVHSLALSLAAAKQREGCSCLSATLDT